jgi:hypothetical protein
VFLYYHRNTRHDVRRDVHRDVRHGARRGVRRDVRHDALRGVRHGVHHVALLAENTSHPSAPLYKIENDTLISYVHLGKPLGLKPKIPKTKAVKVSA